MLTKGNKDGREMSSEYFPCDPDVPTVSYVDNDSGDQFTAFVSDRAVHSWKPQGVLSTMQLNIIGNIKNIKNKPRPDENQANDENPAVTSKEALHQFIAWPYRLLPEGSDRDENPAVTSKGVLHYQFTAWPYRLLPEGSDREALISLSGASRHAEEDTDGSPRIVHSSRGGERTGTFIALDFLLGEIEDGAMENSDAQTDMIFDTVYWLRQQRIRMVQYPKSYEFLYEVLKEDLTRKLALDAKQFFLSRWSKVLISASVTLYDYENRMFCINGCSADGIDRSISRSGADLFDLQDGLQLKFPSEEILNHARRYLPKILTLTQFANGREQWRERRLLCRCVDDYIHTLISSPPEIAISTEYLEFFTPRKHESRYSSQKYQARPE